MSVSYPNRITTNRMQVNDDFSAGITIFSAGITMGLREAMREAVTRRDNKVAAEVLGFVLRGYSMKQIRVRMHPPRMTGQKITLEADVVAYGEPMNATKLL